MTEQNTNTIALPTSATTITVKTRFDPKVMLKLFHGLVDEFRGVQEANLEDAEDEAYAAGRLVAVTKLGDSVHEYYEELARPHLDALARLRVLVAPFKNVVALGVGVYTAAIESYRIEQATERAAALEAAKDAAGARDTETLKDALNIAQETKPQKLEGVSMPLEWTVDTIEEPGVVPRVWCCPDLKALNEHAKSVPPNPLEPPVVPGVKFKLVGKKRVRR